MAQKIDWSQSSDGKTLFLTDSSTGDKTGYTRTVELYTGLNGTGTLIDSITFPTGENTVEHDIVKDQYFSAKLIYVGSPALSAVYTNFTTTQFEYNKLNKFLNKGCGCGSKSESEKVRYGFIYLKLAEKATLGGNSGLANQNITASAKWLS